MFEGIVRHQKKFLVALVVVLLVVWLGAGGLGAFLSGRSRVGEVARIYGQPVTAAARSVFAERWARAFGPRVWPASRREFNQAVLDKMAELRFAEKIGLRVGDDELRGYIYASVIAGLEGSGLTYRQAVRAFKQQSVGDYETAIRQKLLIDKLENLLLLDLERSISQRWIEFKDGHRSVKVKVAEIGIDRFLGDTPEPEEKEIRDYYENFKDNVLKIPEKYRIAYVWASYEAMEPLVEVTEDDLRDYYEDEKEVSDRWRINEEKEEPEEERTSDETVGDATTSGDAGDQAAPAPTEADTTAEDASSDSSPEPPARVDADSYAAAEPDATAGEPDTADGGDVDAAAAAGEADLDAPQQDDEPRYRPFEQVREEVEAAYRKEYAREVAEGELDKVRTRLDKLAGTEATVSVEMLDEAILSSGSRGVVRGMTDYFALDDAPKIPAVEKAQPIEYAENFLEDVEIWPRLANDDGALFYVLVDRKPSRTPELDEVADTIVDTLKRAKAQEMLESYVAELEQRAQTKGQSFDALLEEEKLESKVEPVAYNRTYEFSSEPYAPEAFKMQLGEIATHIEDQKAYIFEVVEVREADYNAFLEQQKTPEKRQGPYDAAAYIEAQKLRPYFMEMIRKETGLVALEAPENKQ